MLEASPVLPRVVLNDLRPVVARRVPVVTRLISAMCECGALVSEMSGSGPAVFGVFADPEQASAARERLEAGFPEVRFILTRLDPNRTRVPGV
jgi:4-diphosphocytidyl-2-C-methyl-D-erythritol kinase